MKVMPADSGSVATWAHWDEANALAAVWTEKKRGKGEDAPPTGLYHRSGARGVIAVYDGAGGAGAREVGRTPDEEVSGAFVASRAARFALEDWFVTTAPKRQLDDGGDLHGALLDGLRQTGITPSGKIRGDMVRIRNSIASTIAEELKGGPANTPRPALSGKRLRGTLLGAATDGEPSPADPPAPPYRRGADEAPRNPDADD